MAKLVVSISSIYSLLVNQNTYHFSHSPAFMLVLSFTNNQGNFKGSISLV